MNIDYKIILILFATSLLCGCAVAVLPIVGTTILLSEDRRTVGTVIEDQNIELKIANQLFIDQKIKGNSHVNVTSYEKIVLVTGEADTEEIKQRIIDIIRYIRHVEHVYDELTIAEPSSLVSRSKDTLLGLKAKTKLIQMKDINALHIKVVVEKGVIYLMGLVTKSEGEIATEYVRQISGVKQVVQLFEYIESISEVET